MERVTNIMPKTPQPPKDTPKHPKRTPKRDGSLPERTDEELDNWLREQGRLPK